MTNSMDLDDGNERPSHARAAVHVALLPVFLRERIEAEEGGRFESVVDELSAEWKAPGDETEKLQNSLRWVATVNW